MQMTEHFALFEFACHDGTPVPDRFVANAHTLARDVLEIVRGFIDRPIAVISGYRTLGHNLAVGGAADSSHMTAEGADIRAGDPAELHEIILELYKAGRLPALGGLGVYPGWVHVDIRKAKDGHLRRWSGSRTGDEKA